MGHFSHSCHLSGLPITGNTKAVLLPILPKDGFGYEARHDVLTRCGQSCLVSNDGPNLYFEEMCFPIFGEYDGYGGLTEIEKDDNTEVLEKYFEMSIEEIVSCILDGRKHQFKVDTDDEEDEFGLSESKELLQLNKYPQRILLVRASTTWYRRDVYDKLKVWCSSILIETFSKKEDFRSKIGLGVHGLLVKLGFTKGEELKGDRFTTPYTKGKVTIYSDGNWISNKKGQMGDFHVYHLSDLKEWMNKKGEDIEIEEFLNMSYNEQVYEIILPSIDKLKPNDRWGSERVLNMLLGRDHYSLFSFLDDDKTMLEWYTESLERFKVMKVEKPEDYKNAINIFKFDPIEYFEKNLEEEKKKPFANTIPLVYFKTIKEKGNGFLKKNLGWHIVKSYYYSTGRFLYPIGTSPQDGDHKGVLTLLEAATSCLKKELAKCSKPNCDCVEQAEKKAGGPVKSYPCLAEGFERTQCEAVEQKTALILKNQTIDILKKQNDVLRQHLLKITEWFDSGCIVNDEAQIMIIDAQKTIEPHKWPKNNELS